MKPVALALALLALSAGAPVVARAAKPPEPAPATERYALGFLYKGSKWTAERTPHTDSIQAGHMANIRTMWEAGKLVAAGPCGGDPLLRGIFVWKVDSLSEIPPLLQGDPALQSGRLRAEVHNWYAEPGIGAEYRARKQADPAGRDSMVTFSLVLLQRGPAYTSNWTKQVQHVLRDHAKHADKLRAEGLLVLGGSIEGLGDPRGMLVFAADTARTRTLLAADPAVKSGRFVPFIWQWWTALGNVPGH